MNKRDILKNKARQITVIPSAYKIEIEDYSEDGAVFVWRHPDDEDIGIWIELNGNGELIVFSKDESTEERQHEILDQENLKKKAMQFIEIHYPGVISKFTEECVKKTDETLRFSYIEMALDLPLPYTGFYIDVNEYGEIMKFRYDGAAKQIVYPDCLLPKEKARAEFLKDIKMNLMIVSLNEELYENGDNLPRLVYEPELRFYEVPANGDLNGLREKQEEDEPEPVYKNVPKQEFTGSPETLTNLDDDYKKIREQDLGDAIGVVYRKDGDEPDASDNSFNAFFAKRNDNTIKVKRDKITGELLGFFSFAETSENQLLSIKECERTAVQFLHAIYSDAHLYFMMNQEIESDEKRALFQFDLIHHGVPVRYGSARINVNRTTGKITHYLGPEVEPKLIKAINPNPGISSWIALEQFSSVFEVELKWTKEYKEHSQSYYQLVYQPVYPKFEGNLSFIDAMDGEYWTQKEF